VQRSRSKEDMWRCVESALTSVTAHDLLSALCIHADENSTALAQRTADIDISKDAEKLRYEMFTSVDAIKGELNPENNMA